MRSPWRTTGALFVGAAGILVSGCFAIFGLDGYGPPSTPEDASVSDAAPDVILVDAADASDAARKVVFVTSGDFGVQALDGPSVDGVSNAHTICNQAAKAAKLSGTFKAWLSDSNGASPSKEFAALAQGSGPTLLVNPQGGIIASSYGELADGGPRIAIAMTETAQTLQDTPAGRQCLELAPDKGLVWTSTDTAGRPDLSNNTNACQDWRNSKNGQIVRVGRIAKAPIEWTSLCAVPCTIRARLYCFEQ